MVSESLSFDIVPSSTPCGGPGAPGRVRVLNPSYKFETLGQGRVLRQVSGFRRPSVKVPGPEGMAQRAELGAHVQDREVGGSGVRGEILVDGTDRARALSNGGGNPLHGSQPHIADGEDPRCRGLERQRLP